MAIFKKNDNYWIDFYAQGRRIRERVGPSRRQAVEVERRRRVELAEKRYFPDRNRLRLSFAAMADLYWDLHASRRPSAHVTQYHLGALKKAFSGKRLDEIGVTDVLGYANAVKARASAATANRHLVILKSIFNRAIEWEKFAGPNPAAKVKQFRVDNARLRFLSKDEVARLLAACNPRLYPIVVCALLTGMRKGELCRLAWEHIDLENGTIYVLKSKSGRSREIPLAQRLHEVLLTMGPKKEGLVFELADMCLRRYFSAALKSAVIEDFRFHDLRHTFASHFVMRTGDLPAAQRLLGHHSPMMTQRYAHLSAGHLRAGIERLSLDLETVWTPGVDVAVRPGESPGQKR